MWVYLLKSGACLAIFFAFYKLFLEKQNMHVFKRFYLLGALLISFGIPFITFVEYIEIAPEPFVVPLETTYIDTGEQPIIEPINYWPYILWSLYFLGAAVFAIRFITNFGKLIYKIQRNPKIKQANHTNVLLKPKITPHTFFKYIFLNKRAFEDHKIPKEVILHEAAHAKQKHSIDLVFIEFLQIIFWFNPLLYVLKKAIKLNHEFLADQAVLENGVSLPTYQELLLAFSSNANRPQLANAINYSSFKKRFTVMKTQTTSKAVWLRSLLLLPLLAVLVFSFSTKEVVEKEIPIAKNTIIQDTYTPEASEKMMEEYRNFIKEFEKTNVVYAPKYNRIVAIYSLMSASQKASVKKYPPVPPTNLAAIKRKTPSQKEFNSWKDKNKFAIWIDGKHVPNSTLNNYKYSDIVYYSGSFVYNNARSEKFPQEYQYNLYTSKGYEQTYLKSNVNKYNAIKKQYQEALKSNNQDEIQILKTRLQSTYEKLSNEEKETYNIKKSISSTSQEKATKKMIAEYNAYIREINKKPKSERIYKVKDVNRIKYIYSLMSDEQKKNAEPFPKFPPPPPPPARKNILPPPPPPPIPEDATPEQKAKYKKAHQEYKKQVKSGDYNYTVSNNEEVKLVGLPEVIEVEEIPEEVVEDPASQEQKTGYTYVNGEAIYFVKEENKITYYNRWGQEVDKAGKVLPSKHKEQALERKQANKKIKTYVNQHYNISKLAKQINNYPNGFLALTKEQQGVFMREYKKLNNYFNQLKDSDKKLETLPKMLPPPPSPKMYKIENGKLVNKN